ncbi:alpha/beta hydrolase [Stenotrophomonas pictorum]|uniref:alpha/beta hydrolase n=1 Tax=Stenotrophomonas pictorum TaxID=86184 RepID=UPI0012FE57A9|nr:alpha/beta fold hydrolase [Stenotrophomonas pictorum]
MKFALIAASLVSTGCTWRVRESNILFPRASAGADVAALQNAFPVYTPEEFYLQIPDARLYGVMLLRPDARATVLYFGGNGYRIAKDAENTIQAYGSLPVNLVLVDHRGYGASSGVPSMDDLMADAVRVYDHVIAEAALSALPVVVHGHSLGSFMAGHVASERTLAGLVLESTVTTTEDWTRFLRSRQPWWAKALVWRVVPEGSLAGRGNLGVVSALNEPVLFAVGAADTVTAPAFSRRLFDLCPLPASQKTLLEVAGASHQSVTRTVEFRETMLRFVDSLGEPQVLSP